jgi:predicted lysophospholipase L1 biosynthesis ABC-type transport system permease subunit
MKSFISLALFAVSALAQRVQIGLPTENQRITAGDEVVVQVQRPVSFDTGCIAILTTP